MLQLNSSGLYFIEDMHVVKLEQFQKFDTCLDDINVLNKLKGVLNELIHTRRTEVIFLFFQKEAYTLDKK